MLSEIVIACRGLRFGEGALELIEMFYVKASVGAVHDMTPET